MILILLSLIVGATSQANCSNETAEGRIGCIASNIQSIVNISDALHEIEFDVESGVSKESERNLRSMINMTDKICVCHMQANAYKHHLQKYLFSSKKHLDELPVNTTVSLLINLQIMSETFQEIATPKKPCVEFTSEEYRKIYKLVVPCPSKNKHLLKSLEERAKEEWVQHCLQEMIASC